MQNVKIKKILSVIPLIINLIGIYIFSSQSGTVSGGMSNRMARKVATFLCDVRGKSLGALEYEDYVAKLNELIREAGHAGEHALLMLCFFLPISCILRFKGKPLPFFARLGLSFVCTFFCAVFDEFHQSFVYGRVSDPFDVLVDCVGALIMAAVITLVWAIKKMREADTMRRSVD